MAKSDEYKTTWLDRGGFEAAMLLRTLPYAVVGFFLVLFALTAKTGFHWWTLPLAALGGAGVGILPIMFGHAAGSTMHRFVAGGNTTPYVEQYSYQQSMVMRGDVDGALESFEAVIAADPAGINPRVKAAELYVRERKNHQRAAELFRDAQRIPTITVGEYTYVTNRLVDLLVGPLDDPGRALVELRRLAERYPGSPSAENARAALATLKSRMNAPPE